MEENILGTLKFLYNCLPDNFITYSRRERVKTKFSRYLIEYTIQFIYNGAVRKFQGNYEVWSKLFINALFNICITNT